MGYTWVFEGHNFYEHFILLIPIICILLLHMIYFFTTVFCTNISYLCQCHILYNIYIHFHVETYFFPNVDNELSTSCFVSGIGFSAIEVEIFCG